MSFLLAWNPRQRDPMVLEDPVRDEGLQVDIRGDSKTGEEEKVIVHFHCQLGQWWSNKINTTG